MTVLKTRYLGLDLKNPLVASSSPLGDSLDDLRRLEEAGAAAVVLPSLFEEQIELESHDLERMLAAGAESFAEAVSYLPEMRDYNLGADRYLEHVRKAKEALGIPVLASLNGSTPGGWLHYARWMQDAGADGIELNLYDVPTDPARTAAEVEERYVEVVRSVRKELKVPLAIKLSPFFSSLPNFAARLAEAGARGLVIFNRFYQPDFDLEKLEIVPDLKLSRPEELQLRLRWIAVLFGRVDADLALTGGVHSGVDVLKAMMAGAKVAMTTSALLERGIGRLAEILREVEDWMEEHEYSTVEQMQGSMSLRSVAEPAAFERANYMKVLRTFALRMRRETA